VEGDAGEHDADHGETDIVDVKVMEPSLPRMAKGSRDVRRAEEDPGEADEVEVTKMLEVSAPLGDGRLPVSLANGLEGAKNCEADARGSPQRQKGQPMPCQRPRGA